MNRGTLVASLAVLALVGGWTASDHAAVGNEGDPAGDLVGFADAERGTQLSVVVSGADAGTLSFFAVGIGAFTPGEPVAVESGGQDHWRIDWKGSGLLDSAAVYEPGIGLTPGANPSPVEFSIKAQVHSDLKHANAHLKWDKQNLLLNTRETPLTAEPALDAVLERLAVADWGPIWDMSTPDYQAAVARSDFESEAAAAYAARGELVGAERTSSMEYTVSADGAHFARARIVLRIAEADGVAEVPVEALLVLVGTEWRWFSLNPSEE